MKCNACAWCLLHVLLVLLVHTAVCGGLESQGPAFVQEPAHRVEFSNSSGGRADCRARGSPAPAVEWLLADGAAAYAVPGLRVPHPNGSLVFPAFAAEHYRQDVHAAMYRCRLRSPLGVVLSREVHIRAVVKQKYDVQVYDEYVIAGNTAVLRCQVPSYVADYVLVTAWVQDGAINIYPSTDLGGKYAVLPDGHLYISDAGPSDGYKNYACRTLHRLTGEVQTSAYPGRVIVTEPKGSVQPRVTVDRHAVRRAAVGDDVTLPCVAQGNPVPAYRWFREGPGPSSAAGQLAPLSVGGRLSLLAAGLLRIGKVRAEDAGRYTCVANNSAGEESVRVTLEVTAPLTAHVQPGAQVVDAGKRAVFQCIVGGYPVRRVAWLHDGKPVAEDGRVSLTGAAGAGEPAQLAVRQLGKADRGMYQCVVSNDADQAQAAAELALGDAGPELAYWFSEQTLQPGPSVSLKCVASGNPPPQFTWTLDGFPVPTDARFVVGQYVTVHDDVISHVNVTAVRAEDGGEYACTAHNAVGRVTHAARVNVYGLPYIREMPKVTGVAGADLSIKCPVAGYPIESVTWERDGQQLPVNRRQRVFSNGTLRVEQTQRREDAGTYTCQAQNRQKNTARRDVEVQILVPPKILPIQAMTNLLREGMRAAISCQILEGDLPISFRWERNGRAITGAEPGTVTRRIDEFSASLVIERVSSAHSGNYTCVATNVAGSESFTVPLTVNVPPRWTVEPTDASVASGQQVTLHCQAEGYPTPSVTWRRAVGEQPGEYKEFLFEPHVQQHPNGSLSFARVSKDSEGHYLCEAKNSIGSGVSKLVNLRVNAPARFPHKSRQVQVQRGEQAHLQCTATGDAPVKIAWSAAGQPLAAEPADARLTVREQQLVGSTMSELGIARTVRQDTGMFTCTASNAFGQDSMNIQLIVQEMPESPRNIRVTDQQSRSIGLSWTQPYAGNSAISGYVVQYKPGSDAWPAQPARLAVPGSQTAAAVQGLRPAQVYHVRVLAENRLGLSEPSDVVQVSTLEEVPSGAPVDVRAEAKSSTELVVTWEPPARDTWNGNLLGYHVGYQEAAGPGGAHPNHTLAGGAGAGTTAGYTFKSVEVRAHFGGEATLHGLSKYATYSVLVQAYNSRGSGPASAPVTARTLEDVPTLPPEAVQCAVLGAQSVHVTWEPPLPEGRNGVVQGYKVTHHSVSEWLDKDDLQTKATSMQRATIAGLRKYTNYSITVLAYTARGDGVQSEPVYCRTEQDVPSAPADIKALLSAPDRILVSWLPPRSSNGPLVGYTFYMSALEDGREEGTHKRVLSPSTESHETVRVQDSATYQFWVTASTKVGEGEATRVVSVTPSATVPARIASFGREVVTAWKRDVQLPCRRVGVPLPRAGWRQNEQPLELGGRRRLGADAALLIKDVQSQDQANYSCAVENAHGRDEVVYALRVLVPPEPPALAVLEAFADSLRLQWTDRGSGGSPVLGYVINYKRDHGDWEELQVGARAGAHLLRGLWCGTRYQLYVTAFNRIGTGLPCDIVHAFTKGTAPARPKQSQMLTANATAATVWLDSWGDGGCGILHFVVEYRGAGQSAWTTASNHVKPTERVFSVAELWPATEYQVRVTALNNAGATVAVYNFTTLTALGGVPALAPPVSHSGDQPFYASARVLVPAALALLALPALAALAALLVRRRKLRRAGRGRSGRQDREDREDRSVGESPSVAHLQNKQNRDQQYLAVRVGRGPHPLALDADAYKAAESADYIEDICPYATFQLSKPAYSESSYSGNVYSGPYHSVRGSFVYHDVKPPPPADKYGRAHGKEPEYTKVRRKAGRLRDPHSESQESDNLGSTDSEVKKILTLHLPISEYDTLGSDSEGDGGAHTSQELVSFRHRLARDMSKGGVGGAGGAAESSSSSEGSPTAAGRKPYVPRKAKAKAAALGKRHVRSSSGYSSHNDETTFSISHAPSFSERIHPPSRFSDLPDAEPDKPGHKGSRAAAAAAAAAGLSKLTREAFQINV